MFRECNPKIHEEIPFINEYKGRKNLRNLLQAYSTSSYRPSYERMGNDYGLYATHLCKYLFENIPVTKIFEQVGKCKFLYDTRSSWKIQVTFLAPEYAQDYFVPMHNSKLLKTE